MKRTVYLICFAALLYSCKAPSYSYVPPAMNNVPYSKAGEVHLAAQLGTCFALRGGIALTQNVNLNAWIGGLPSDSGYRSSEAELSLGFQTNPHNNTVTSFYVGYGNGHNKKFNTGLSGHFNRPFVQVQYGGYDKGSGNLKFDGYFGLRINYLDYDGSKPGNVTVSDNLFYYEPFMGMALGGKNVRFQVMQGFAIKNSGEWGDGVRVFPYFINLGILVKIRKG
jgi:hypothetical protein